MVRSEPGAVSRRGLLTGALVAGVAVATGVGVAEARSDPAGRRPVTTRQVVSPPPATGDPVPRLLTATGTSALDPGFPLEYLGVTWSGAPAGRIRFRTATGWGPWSRIQPGDAPVGQGALIPAAGALAAELDPAPGTTDLQLLAINASDGPRTERVLLAPGRRYGSRYRNRASWGADESLRLGDDGRQLWPPAFHRVQALTVHHQGAASNQANPAATVRAIYAYQAAHPDNAWGDIGYHLLIDHTGTVYEGRYSGSDASPVFGPSRRAVEAGHAYQYNPGNIGVVLLGDLTSTQPTAAARRTLVRVLASLARTTGLDPLGTTTYRNPATGATRRVKVISGHRDWNPTQCPGNTFYPTLPALRQEVAALLASGQIIR